MEEAILLSTSMRRGGMKTMKPVFFIILAFALSVFVASVHMCEMQTQAQM